MKRIVSVSPVVVFACYKDVIRAGTYETLSQDRTLSQNVTRAI